MAEDLVQEKLIAIIGMVVESLATSYDPLQVVNLTLDRLVQILAIDCSWVQLLDETINELILAAHRGFTQEMIEETASMRLGQSLTGYVASTGEVTLVPDISAEPRYTLISPGKAGLCSFAAAPLRSAERVLGVIGIASHLKSQFTNQVVTLLSIIGNLIGVAVCRASLYQQIKHDQEELAMVNQLTRIIASNLDIKQVYEAFANETRKIMPVDWTSIVLIKGDELHFYALSSKIRSTWKTSDVIPLEGTATAYIARTKALLIEPDLSRSRKFWTGEHHLKQGIGSIVYMPLLANEEVFGALIIGSVRPNAYGQRELTLLNQIAGQIAMPIQNALLFEEGKQRQDLLQAISQISRTISSNVTLDDISQAFAQELKKLTDFDHLSFYFVKEARGGFLTVSDEASMNLPAGITCPLEVLETGWVVKHKKTLIQHDLARPMITVVDEVKLKQGLKSSIHVPLFSKDEVFGTLNLYSFHPNAYGEREQDILEQLATQVAGTILSAQLYRKVESHARVDELTGVFNRRYFSECVENEIKRQSRYKGIFSVAILDLDSFKECNDKYGHVTGDKILRDTAELMKSFARNTDLVFRYGGDEFVILFLNTDGKGAYPVCERVRKGVEVEMAKREIPLTVSIGIASWSVDGVRESELVRSADAALYQAKLIGGNRTYQFATVPIAPVQTIVPEFETEKATLGIIQVLAKAVEARDIYSYGHSREVNRYALALAEAIGFSEKQLRSLSACALLHDIGKIGIPDKVLRKHQGKLNDEEWQWMKEHPRLGSTIISHISTSLPCQLGILHHHERWDGTGYPEGIRGEEIPVEARILAIADAFTAMVSARNYRPTLSYSEAIEELKREAGIQFDPNLVETFVTVARKPLSEN